MHMGSSLIGVLVSVLFIRVPGLKRVPNFENYTYIQALPIVSIAVPSFG